MLTEYIVFQDHSLAFGSASTVDGFLRLRTRLLLTLANRKGILPSSLFKEDITRLEDRAFDHGGYGDVWKGSMGSELVAIKVGRIFSRPTKQEQECTLSALYIEALLWKMTRHPNVLQFVGLRRSKEATGLVELISPWMRNGNLLSFVKSNEYVKRVDLLSQVAEGLCYLHDDVNLIHGDLKCANILVNDIGVAQLADFGLSSFEPFQVISVGSSSTTSSAGYAGGTPRWQAPELFLDDECGGSRRHTRMSDIYSFGMTAWELFAEEVPFSHLSELEYFKEVIYKSTGGEPIWLRTTEDAEMWGLLPEVWELMKKCWTREPYMRVDSKTLRELFQSLGCGLGTGKDLHSINIIVANSSRGNTRLREGSIRRISRDTMKGGWFGRVWNAEWWYDLNMVDQTLPVSKDVSARVLNVRCDDIEVIARLEEVTRRWSLINHENIARVHELHVCVDRPPLGVALIFECGPTAMPLIGYLRELGVTSRIKFLKKISKGLDFLHQNGVVHGDLRSANIIVDNGVVKLVDYGWPSCCRESHDSLTSRIFRAPEFWSSNVNQIVPTKEGDIYSLAMSFYEVAF
ncbi:kinase-like protein [Schizopora paradoxa]|uniref:Kinase-like protein n=1 Tax=Schizopora paradoxa TaxID=27342 RepID=A0A0H2S388_9AGAM|nr:kinase-like protein [Schizopora paradoxa]